jgi:CheY-like chemotaxis protein
LELRPLDLGQLVGGMENMLRRLLGADVALTFTSTASNARVNADPGMIEQVVLNLVVNARHAMPLGGKLTIETQAVSLDEEYARAHANVTPGAYVMLGVSDTGIGMDRQTQERIFEPFYTTKGLHEGTGLGLSTVYGIVNQSGGHIWVYSEPGTGTTFKVYFPQTDAPIDVEAAPLPAAVGRGDETILLVEDDDQVRLVAHTILARQGYLVLEASNADDALRICEEHDAPIHLLLSDVVLPKVGGRRAAERISALRPQIKLLFMSGYTDEAMMQHGILDAQAAYLQKPLTPESLTRRVRQVLGPAK